MREHLTIRKVYISVNQLEREMGVDKKIARFFVDRRVPDNNSFWKDRLLYIGFGNGYVSIPVYYDLLHRIGLGRDILLEESHVGFMESLMHYAILQERNEISVPEEMTAIRGLLEKRVSHDGYFQMLNQYLDQPRLSPLGPFGLDFPSLNRADAFLYVLCDLPLTRSAMAVSHQILVCAASDLPDHRRHQGLHKGSGKTKMKM